jgi:hypothetical protein
MLRTPSQGSRVANARLEIALGGRAVAVLEPGAHICWRGSTVGQDRDDVFHRVKPGGPHEPEK